MSRRLPIIALLGALMVVSGCGSSPTTGAGKAGSAPGGPAVTGKPTETGKSSAKGGDDHHNPG